MKSVSLLSLAVLLCLSAGTVRAENYEVSLTRKSKNLYQVDGKDIIVQTRYCYVYGYSEDALLKSAGYGGEVIFFGSRDKCDVKAVFGAAKQKPGKYTVRVSHEEDDWYEVFGTSTFIRTSGCLSLVLGQEALLMLTSSNYGQLRFENGNDCIVEGIYSKLRL